MPQNENWILATLAYIILGLIITTMCIDLVGSAYIRDIHFYGRTIGKSFMMFGGKVSVLSFRQGDTKKEDSRRYSYVRLYCFMLVRNAVAPQKILVTLSFD